MDDAGLRAKLQEELRAHKRTAAALSAAQRETMRLQRELEQALADLKATAAQRDKLRDLSTTLQTMHRDSADAMHSAAADEIARREQESQRIGGLVTSVQARLDAYATEQQKVIAENAALRAQVEHQSAHLEAALAAAAADMRAKELTAALEAARARQAEAAAAVSAAAAEDAQAQLARMRASNDTLLREQAGALATVLPQVKQSLALVDAYKQEMEKLSAEKARATKRLADTEAALGKLVEERAGAARAIAAAAAQRARLEALARTLQAERSTTRARVAGAVRALRGLGAGATPRGLAPPEHDALAATAAAGSSADASLEVATAAAPAAGGGASDTQGACVEAEVSAPPRLEAQLAQQLLVVSSRGVHGAAVEDAGATAHDAVSSSEHPGTTVSDGVVVGLEASRESLVAAIMDIANTLEGISSSASATPAHGDAGQWGLSAQHNESVSQSDIRASASGTGALDSAAVEIPTTTGAGVSGPEATAATARPVNTSVPARRRGPSRQESPT